MKRLILYFAFFALALQASSAQTPDTVNGWSKYRIIGNQSAIMVSHIVSDTATEGTKSQSFWSYLPENTNIQWQKDYSRVIATPEVFSLDVRMDTLNPMLIENDIIFGLYLKNGDSLFPTDPGLISVFERHRWVDCNLSTGLSQPPPSTFTGLVLEFRTLAGNAALFTELKFDNLRLVYMSGYPSHVDSIITLDRFGDDAILPVELSSFTGSVLDGRVVLKWTTATEVSNYGFEIERKTADSGEWAKVGFVSGYGTSNAPHDYSFTDIELPFGRYLYRLKQIDSGGAFEYSPIVEVVIGSTLSVEVATGNPRDFALANYPNPWNPSTVISFTIPRAALVSLKVYNVLGQEVATLVEGLMPGGKHSVRFEAGRLPSGVYLYRLTAASPAGEFSESKRMLFVK